MLIKNSVLRYLVFISFIFCGFKSQADENPVIYMLFSPRSVSTAFLKMMHYRGDFFTINEPLITLFFQEKAPDHAIERRNAFEAPEDFENQLRGYQKLSPVFLKDSATHFAHYYDRLPKSICEESFFHLFLLVRDPAEIMVSFYRALEDESDSQAFMKFFRTEAEFSRRVGTKALYDMFMKINQITANPPKMIFSDQIARDPSTLLKAFCSETQIPFSEQHLSWPSNEYDFLDICKSPNGEYPAFVEDFYGSAAKSSHFHSPKGCMRDANGVPTFEEIENLELRSLFFRVYFENKKYYKKMLEAREYHLVEMT